MHYLMLLSTLALASAVQAAPTTTPAAPAATPSSTATGNAAEDWKTLRCLADKDGNDKLTKEEMGSFNPVPARLVARNFTEMDSNKDGQLTLEEYTKFMQKGRAELEAQFKAADLDKSGGLSQAELDKTPRGQFALLKRQFKAADSNGDGQITLAEREAFNEKAREVMQGKRPLGERLKGDDKPKAEKAGEKAPAK